MKQKKRGMKPTFASINAFMEKVAEPSFKEEIVQEDNRYYLIPKDVKDIKDSISRSTFLAGTFLGEKKRGLFSPSLAFIDLLAQEADKSKIIILDKKSSWLFLCGRDVFGSSLEVKPKDGFLYVQNERNENIGLGFFNGRDVMNVLDRGDFLRREH